MVKSSILMILGSAILLGLFVFPLWNIMLGAPQYPVPLGMNIHITGISGVSEFDLQNIDGLNHYIGMQTIPKTEEMVEFKIFPIVIATMSLIGIALGVAGLYAKAKPSYFLIWLVVMSILSCIGMYDFNLWLTEYGTNLDPQAIMKMVDAQGNPLSYKPPLMGHRKILNFDAYSYPHTGAYLMMVALILVLTSYFIGKRALKNE